MTFIPSQITSVHTMGACPLVAGIRRVKETGVALLLHLHHVIYNSEIGSYKTNSYFVGFFYFLVDSNADPSKAFQLTSVFFCVLAREQSD